MSNSNENGRSAANVIWSIVGILVLIILAIILLSLIGSCIAGYQVNVQRPGGNEYVFPPRDFRDDFRDLRDDFRDSRDDFRATDCPSADERHFYSPTDITVSGPAIIHVWWPHGRTPWEKKEVKVRIPSGTTVTFFQAQGSLWRYVDNSACRSNLENEIRKGAMNEVSIGELQSRGLAR